MVPSIHISREITADFSHVNTSEHRLLRPAIHHFTVEAFKIITEIGDVLRCRRVYVFLKSKMVGKGLRFENM